MCEPLVDPVDVEYLKLYIAMGMDTLAMGNFPFPSDYLTGDGSMLPAWPMRVACAKLDGVDLSDAEEVLEGVREATAVFYNASGQRTCHQLPADHEYDGIWDYQWYLNPTTSP